MVSGAIDVLAARLDAWARSERRFDVGFHIREMREYETSALSMVSHGEIEAGDLDWTRRRIEGHAARAIAAFLLWGLS